MTDLNSENALALENFSKELLSNFDPAALLNMFTSTGYVSDGVEQLADVIEEINSVTVKTTEGIEKLFNVIDSQDFS